jgi:hypothetical protein
MVGGQTRASVPTSASSFLLIPLIALAFGCSSLRTAYHDLFFVEPSAQYRFSVMGFTVRRGKIVEIDILATTGRPSLDLTVLDDLRR